MSRICHFMAVKNITENLSNDDLSSGGYSGHSIEDTFKIFQILLNDTCSFINP